jgi:hypothetical protein
MLLAPGILIWSLVFPDNYHDLIYQLILKPVPSIKATFLVYERMTR